MRRRRIARVSAGGRLARQVLVAAIAASLIAPDRARSQPAGVTTSIVTLRATTPNLPDDLLRYIARKAQPTRLARANYPEAGLFSAREAIRILCGSVRESYLAEFRARNGHDDVDGPMGAKAFEFEFPACPYVRLTAGDVNYIIASGEVASAVRLKLTGVPGKRETNARYFSLPPGKLDSLSIGQQVPVPYITAPTTLFVEDASGFTKGMMTTVPAISGAVAPQVAADNLLALTKKTPPSKGRIIMGVRSGPAAITEPVECAGFDGEAFDARRVADAYGYSTSRGLGTGETARVFVIDNGFFGVTRAPAALSFNHPDRFAKDYFNTFDYAAGFIGPVLTITTPETYPINFQNQLTVSDDIAGHGTHVTGLVLGGPAFMPFRSILATGSPFKIAILNVGRGSDVLINGSEQTLANHIGFLKTPHIVNLSLTYQGGLSAEVDRAFPFINEDSPHLYVVAAGNDSVSDVQGSGVYPAAFGGPAKDNVITVAALTQVGRLATFSNTGRRAVDVAAPGCRIRSWIDADGADLAMSGTSQAAPLVTFNAVLLRKLAGLGPKHLKTRILISTDLLADEDQARIASRGRINIAKSLFVFDDYVSYRGPDGTVREVVGDIVSEPNFSCRLVDDPSLPVSWSDVWAYKRGGSATRLYMGKTRPDAPLPEPCVVDTVSATELVVKARREITASGLEDTAGQPDIHIPLADLLEFVRKGPPLAGG